MIEIQDKHYCCGCGACVQACPKGCISLAEDEQGFLYPYVDKSLCVDCGLCERVCPVLQQTAPHRPLHVYAAINPDEVVRMQSSSGGIFSILAESVIEAGGVVFGARFDEKWEVMHDYTETKEGLAAFRGSKYVQSRIGNSYQQAKQFLQAGRKVLFSGTPCQVAGLKHFLRKEYDNLWTIDVVCHGVPSPLVWRRYLNDFILRPEGAAGKNTVLSSLKCNPVLTGLNFRDKQTGWKKYGFVAMGKSAVKADKNSVLSPNSQDITLLHETLDKNLFMQVFLKNLCLRPSCANCPAKSGKSGSDIIVADFWGIHRYLPDWDDDKGTSLVLINTDRGMAYFEQVRRNVKYTETTYEQALAGNPAIEHSIKETKYVSLFWKRFHTDGFAQIPALLHRMKPSLLRKGVMLIKQNLYKCYKWIIKGE